MAKVILRIFLLAFVAGVTITIPLLSLTPVLALLICIGTLIVMISGVHLDSKLK